MTRTLFALALLVAVILQPAAPQLADAQGQNQPSIALYNAAGTATTTFAPGSQIEVRGLNFRDNTTYFVGIRYYVGYIVVDPNPDNTFTAYFTAPSEPWDNYQIQASHFQGGNSKQVVDYTVTFAVA